MQSSQASSVLSSVLTPIITNIVQPGLVFLFILALLYFVWGVYKLIKDAGSEEARTAGGMHILYSSIGMFVMLAAYGLIRLIANTLNVQSPV